MSLTGQSFPLEREIQAIKEDTIKMVKRIFTGNNGEMTITMATRENRLA